MIYCNIPFVILADEPTGNGVEIPEIFKCIITVKEGMVIFKIGF